MLIHKHVDTQTHVKDANVNAVFEQTNKHWNETVPQAVEQILAERAQLPDDCVDHRWVPARPLWEYDDATELAEFKDTTSELQKKWKDLKTSMGAKEIEIVSFNMYSVHTGDIENVYNLPSGLTIPMIVGIYGGQWKLFIENNDINQLAKGAVSSPDDIEQIVADQQAALINIYQQIKTQSVSLSIPLLNDTHKQMLRNCNWNYSVTENGDKVEQIVPLGEFKIAPNHHGLGSMSSPLHQYCPPNKCEDEINNIVKWLNDSKMRDYDPISIATWLHHAITATHPYADGNGRISRFAASLVLLTNNLPPAVIQRPSKVQYIRGLKVADVFRVARLTKFMTTMIEEHIEQCDTLVKVKTGDLKYDLWDRKDIDQLADNLQKNMKYILH